MLVIVMKKIMIMMLMAMSTLTMELMIFLDLVDQIRCILMLSLP